jgi:transposase InsO family protein
MTTATRPTIAGPIEGAPLAIPGITTDLAAITAARHNHAPGRLWIADLSQVWGGTSWLYFAYVLDRDSRHCVAWSPHRVPHVELIAEALREAAGARLGTGLQPPVAVVFGRGCRTAGLDFPRWAIPAASDAAFCDSFVAGLRQAAADHDGECRWASFPEARSAAAAWIAETYNPYRAARPLDPVG